MATKNIINKVKTASGFDVLYPLTPYQIYTATNVTSSVSGNTTTFNLTIPLPAEYMTTPILIRFTTNRVANVNNGVSVNGGTAIAISGNMNGVVKSGDICIVSYDLNNSKCYLINVENKTLDQLSSASSTTTFTDTQITQTYTNGQVVTTTFNANGTITETISANGSTITKTTTFNNDGSITEVVS